MKKIFLFLLLPVFYSAQAPKKYPALLWKITGNNLKKPSYLYGTMHVSNKVAYYLSEQFFDALKSVDVVGLETNPGEWLENMEKTGELERSDNYRGNYFGYGADFYSGAFASYFPDKKILQGILSFDPDIINGLLYRQNRMRENFEESTYIDLFIFQSASKLNKQLISLEDFSQSEIKSRLSTIPDEDPEEGSRSYRGNFYSFGQKIEDAYREGNLDMLDSLSRLSSSKNTQKYLINDRNEFFVHTIDSVLRTKSLFSGVGAAHLPGRHGVIELLRQKGYTVEPVIPVVTRKSHAIREELDARVMSVTFQKQFSTDSLFSLSLPGKLYPVLNAGNLKYYIYADMVNGAFYTTVRLKHLGQFYGISATQMMQKIDSLLFEGIPGKILDKKEITTASGIRGLEIINQTRRGDQQHYQIYFTPTEMIMFKLGGKQGYATGAEARQFFSSISFAPKENKEVWFAPPTKGFKVKLPATYHYQKNNGAGTIGLVEDLFACDAQTGTCYGVKHAVYNDFNYLEEDTFELNQLASGFLRTSNFTINPVYKFKLSQGLPAIECLAKNNTGKYLAAKIVIKGIHYYLVYSTSDRELNFSDAYFASFSLSDFEYINPLKEITDKDLYFKAIDEVSENAQSRFNEAFSKAYEAAGFKKDSLRDNYRFSSNVKNYYSPSSNEYVNISYEKYNDYDYRDPATFEKRLEEVYTGSSGMIIANKKISKNNGKFRFSCILKDTATVRAIDLRLFISNGMIHEISAPFDTITGLKGWAKGFMDSFAPKDTVVGYDIFKNKFEALLNDLSGKDTVKRRAANYTLGSEINFNKAYAPQFISFISGNRFNLVNEDSKASLLMNGGSLNNEGIILPYKNLYKQYTDSFYLQLCLLKGLAKLKTQNSYNLFNSLLMQETPLVGEENTVNDVFMMLHDSLELCRKFFPGMLTLTRYDEYRNPVYQLMAALVDKKLLAPATYSLQKDAILVDANLALKRYSPGQAKNEEEYTELNNIERYARELAENMARNMGNYSGNNFYDKAGISGFSLYGRHSLVNYACLLSPFYKNDEKTKQFFQRLSKIKTNNILIPVTVNLLKQNVRLNDTVVQHFCTNRQTRARFYSELEKEKLLTYFDKRYLSQESINESLIFSEKQANAYYSNEKEKPAKDSLVLVKKVQVLNKHKKGALYVYRNTGNKNDEEKWSVLFIPESKEPVNTKSEIISTAYTIDNLLSEQENINELVTRFYKDYRRRCGRSYSTVYE